MNSVHQALALGPSLRITGIQIEAIQCLQQFHVLFCGVGDSLPTLLQCWSLQGIF